MLAAALIYEVHEHVLAAVAPLELFHVPHVGVELVVLRPHVLQKSPFRGARLTQFYRLRHPTEVRLLRPQERNRAAQLQEEA